MGDDSVRARIGRQVLEVCEAYGIPALDVGVRHKLVEAILLVRGDPLPEADLRVLAKLTARGLFD